MASSRTMRSSRLASPLATTSRDNFAAVEKGTSKSRERQTSLGNWIEPPLRAPAPSFEDYKGLERQGVLEHMAPLGSLPNHKVKQRLKALNGPRRSTQLRNGSNGVTEEEAATPEPAPVPNSRRSEPRKSESRILSSKEKDEDRDYTPVSTTRPSSAKGASAQAIQNTVTSRSSAREQRLRGIVESALKRAEELNNPYLGKALQELFNRSLHDRTMADLLDAVLSQKPTVEQTSAFQAMVKQTRKEIKEAEKQALRQSSSAPGSSMKPSLKSPSKGDSSGGVRRSMTTDLSDAPDPDVTRDTNTPSKKNHAKRIEMNGTASKAERPAKRMKRSYSNASSTSSLSSLTSDHSQRSPRSKHEYANRDRPPLPPPGYRHQGLDQGVGPKLHTFPLRKTKAGSKGSSTPDALVTEPSIDEVAAKRRSLQKSFDYTVNDSALRDPPTIKLLHQRRRPHKVASPLPLRTQQTRLRNGAHRLDLVEDHDVPSSASSYHGEFLAPPTVDGHILTRGATPSQLGRPSKHIKKGARIKMSPQKAKPTTAGQPRPGGDGDADGLSDNASELDNDDICAACGGEGEVLCCDGCTRSFHLPCLDPPKHKAPEGEWLCRHCIATKLRPQGLDLDNSVDGVTDGALNGIFKKLQAKNPTCFYLPMAVRDYFENVRTSASGEYEEALPPKSKTRGAAYELAELAKAKETIKEAVALCYACGGSSSGLRELIGCTYCPLFWHLDCLNPPLATSPFRYNKQKPDKHNKTTWQCPNHKDSELHTTELNPSGKVKKVRRPKHATIKDVALSRGYVNNGIIEILNDPSDPEDEGAEAGIVPRLQEKGIKLDFAARVRRENLGTSRSVLDRDAQKAKIAAAAVAEKRKRATALQNNATQASKATQTLVQYPFPEQQAALALASFQSSGAPVTGTTQVETLIATLIQEAPEEVATLMAGDKVITDEQADFLRLVVANIQQLLAKKTSSG